MLIKLKGGMGGMIGEWAVLHPLQDARGILNLPHSLQVCPHSGHGCVKIAAEIQRDATAVHTARVKQASLADSV